MEKLENFTIPKLNYTLPFYKRYVDDILTSVHLDNIKDIVDKFNQFHPNLQFTFETQNINSISFLDLNIININNTLRIDWFRKHTWSGRYLHFGSHHPLTYKKSVITGLVDRELILAKPEFREKNLKLVKKLTIVNDNSTKITILLPYVQGLSENLKGYLKKFNIKVVHKTQNTSARIFTRLKDTDPTMLHSNLVYKLDCLNCENAYIGQTSQHLKKRINDHRYTIKCKDPNKSALSNHSLSLGQKFDFDNPTILTHESNYQNWLVKEMIHISRNITCNKRTDIEHSSNLYAPLLHM
ncbi:uncharacterized protein LOC124416189 [Diprion similis]|uniref:uncharacterized protein LOC124416189 n=1 Tax=Diprion similis TaxID=362088 RepID=UPI001EF890DB|nr:uncharacterized protein LOC124416189 [Diprion similis]